VSFRFFHFSVRTVYALPSDPRSIIGGMLIKPLCSVIIPVINLEDHAERMINWLKEAHSQNIELIIVHDTTTSSQLTSSIILEKFTQFVSQSNIEMINGNFGSPGLARNAGLKVANGDWIVFWDADDKPIPKNLIDVIKLAQKSDYEIAISSFKINSNREVNLKRKIANATVEQIERTLIRNLGLWRFAFRREIIGTNRFISTKMGEDQVFVSMLGIFNKKIYTSSTVTYEYFTSNSKQLTKQKKAINDLRISITETFKTSQKHFGINKKVSEYFFMNQIFAGLIHCSLLNKINILWFLIHQVVKKPKLTNALVRVLIWKIL
jgi:glycosyltransferase involved in cell wall biosynthesis